MGELSGTSIAGYQLAEEIGQGGVAVVYRAYQPQLERWVAFKILRTAEAGGPQFVRRFQRETQAVAVLRHPNIVTIHDYGEDQGMAYIVMEYVEGGALSQRISDVPGDIADMLALCIPLSEALAYAHTRNVIHRDVKPSNVLLARPDWPLLADFGLVKVIGTQKLALTGSPAYRSAYFSPEQVAGDEVDPRTDIYSLGILLYQLLTGRLPFGDSTSVEAVMARLYVPPSPPRAFNPRIPLELETVLLRALERDANARYATMTQFSNDLRRVHDRLATLEVRPQQASIEGVITTRLEGPSVVIGPRLFIATSGLALPIPPLEEVSIGRKDPLQPQPPAINLEPHGGGSAGVSRQHARLVRRSQGWFIEDLQSTNGTFLNEVRLLPHRPVRIRTGDLVRLGQFTLVFEEA